MEEEKKDTGPKNENNLEKEEATNIQKKIEEKIEHDEETLEGESLSGELSKDRTHMSEHRTRMSEHRTDMSEHRTDLSEHRTEMSKLRTELSKHRTELSDHRTALSEQRTAKSEERTDLSFQRTALSYERTLMSWVRTAASLISFGFTIYKFFEEMQKTNTEPRLITPRIVGLMMISFGFLGLLFAEIQHRMAYKRLREEYPAIQKSLSSVLAILILAFGFILLLATIFRQ